MANTAGTTSFITIYDSFLARITDDMYLELTELDTIRMLQDLLVNGLYRFEFPRFDLTDYEEGHYEDVGIYQGIESGGLEVPATGWVGGSFNSILTQEEINILSLTMVIEWLGQQLNITDLTKMKYSGLIKLASINSRKTGDAEMPTRAEVNIKSIYTRRA